MYVNAFTLISKDIDPKYKEFSLAAASLGDSLGIAFADVAGILIQVAPQRTLNCLSALISSLTLSLVSSQFT